MSIINVQLSPPISVFRNLFLLLLLTLFACRTQSVDNKPYDEIELQNSNEFIDLVTAIKSKPNTPKGYIDTKLEEIHKMPVPQAKLELAKIKTEMDENKKITLLRNEISTQRLALRRNITSANDKIMFDKETKKIEVDIIENSTLSADYKSYLIQNIYKADEKLVLIAQKMQKVYEKFKWVKEPEGNAILKKLLKEAVISTSDYMNF